jgi:ADP-ribose pyrophosphatase
MSSPPGPELIVRGDHLQLVKRDGWEYVEHLDGADSVAAFATTTTGEVVLIEQRRLPVDRVVLELPAGIVEPGEAPEDAVVRELLEETGFSAAGAPELLLRAPLSAGLTSSMLHLYRVRCGPRVGPGGGVDDERIDVRLVPLHELAASTLSEYEAVDWHIPAALQLIRAEGPGSG